MHRRLLADEDHWIIDARRITPLQSVLSAATWMTVVATILTVWMLRAELNWIMRWVIPTSFTLVLTFAGYLAKRDRDNLAAATFLAGATLTAAPCLLSWLAALGWFAVPQPQVAQLFPDFSNQQVFVASVAALLGSALCLWKFGMTGFAWTTAVLTGAAYLALLMLFGWLDEAPETKALWCLPWPEWNMSRSRSSVAAECGGRFRSIWARLCRWSARWM
jgi:hypothetical protein